jgi:hypothetical protein
VLLIHQAYDQLKDVTAPTAKATGRCIQHLLPFQQVPTRGMDDPSATCKLEGCIPGATDKSVQTSDVYTKQGADTSLIDNLQELAVGVLQAKC